MGGIKKYHPEQGIPDPKGHACYVLINKLILAKKKEKQRKEKKRKEKRREEKKRKVQNTQDTVHRPQKSQQVEVPK